MKMRKNNLIINFLLLLICFSCKDEEKTISKENKKIDSVRFSQTVVDFPDTFLVNKKFKGKIAYKSLFDTLNLKDGKDRFIWFYVNGSRQKVDYKNLHKVKNDTFAINNDTIYFQLIFKETGNNYINGYIEDIVMINDKKDKDKVRIIEKVTDVSYPIYIKENIHVK